SSRLLRSVQPVSADEFAQNDRNRNAGRQSGGWQTRQFGVLTVINVMTSSQPAILTLSPLGRQWFASEANKPGEGQNWCNKTPHPQSRWREIAATPQRGEAWGWLARSL